MLDSEQATTLVNSSLGATVVFKYQLSTWKCVLIMLVKVGFYCNFQSASITLKEITTRNSWCVLILPTCGVPGFFNDQLTIFIDTGL